MNVSQFLEFSPIKQLWLPMNDIPICNFNIGQSITLIPGITGKYLFGNNYICKRCVNCDKCSIVTHAQQREKSACTKSLLKVCILYSERLPLISPCHHLSHFCHHVHLEVKSIRQRVIFLREANLRWPGDFVCLWTSFSFCDDQRLWSG